MQAPFFPEIRGDLDTANFDDEFTNIPLDGSQRSEMIASPNAEFPDFSYQGNSLEMQLDDN